MSKVRRKYKPELINLRQSVKDAKEGRISSVDEIKAMFAEYRTLIDECEVETTEAFNKSYTCEHLEYNRPTWSLRRNVINYYYHFEKTCKCCGHTEMLSFEDEYRPEFGNFPEGFEGAEKVYYNLDI